MEVSSVQRFGFGDAAATLSGFPSGHVSQIVLYIYSQQVSDVHEDILKGWGNKGLKGKT